MKESLLDFFLCKEVNKFGKYEIVLIESFKVFIMVLFLIKQMKDIYASINTFIKKITRHKISVLKKHFA